jgi:hypothetical protein
MSVSQYSNVRATVEGAGTFYFFGKNAARKPERRSAGLQLFAFFIFILKTKTLAHWIA